jgi:hypothetical protein
MISGFFSAGAGGAAALGLHKTRSDDLFAQYGA